MSELCTSFINGGWTSGDGAERIPVISPIDETLVAEIAQADAAEVDHAVRAARKAFVAGTWRNAPVSKRQSVLRRIAALIREKVDVLAERECANAGLPIRQVR